MNIKDKIAATIAILLLPLMFFPWPWVGGPSYQWIQVVGVCGVVLTLIVWSVSWLWSSK